MFTVSIVKRGKGCFVASAKEFPIPPESASTQRGAVKKLKRALLDEMEKAAEVGMLPDMLEDVGYNTDLIWLEAAKIESHPYDEYAVSVPMTRQLALLDRATRSATGQERNPA